MLQQTRVETVIPYYKKFIARFPDFAALANAAPDTVLHYWSGLGYYARARNLHACAKKIVTEHGGVFPMQFDAAHALPGIGKSTAGAILCFAFDARHAVLDANVKRVLARHFAINDEQNLWRIAEQFLPRARIANYNQALMDLGAGVCTRDANCNACPLNKSCIANIRGEQHAFPQPKPKRARPNKFVTMLVVTNRRGEILLIKRPPAGIWGGLWSLPEYAHVMTPKTSAANGGDKKKKVNCKSPSPPSPAMASPSPPSPAMASPPPPPPKIACIKKWCEQKFGIVIKPGAPLTALRHSFTHFDLNIRPLPAAVTDATRITDAAAQIWYNPNKPARIGLPSAVARILEMIDDA